MSGMSEMSMSTSQEVPNPRYVNEQYLLNIIKKQIGITDEDMRSISTVKSKVRESNLDKVLDN
jgi:hypothetical protein